MTGRRWVGAGMAALAGLVTVTTAVATPATAQFYFRAPDIAGRPLTGQEPGLALPGATPRENEAALLWSMRAALNVAALQCDVAQTLLTVPNYNAMLADHKPELKVAFDTLDRYFKRTAKTRAAGQVGLDQYSTRIYSGFSTVNGQYTFCVTAHSIGRDAIFTPRGQLLGVAQARMAEMRNSLAPSYEQYFPGFQARTSRFGWLPNTDKKCWKKNDWNGKCGAAFTAASAAI